jgi:hypothetical protein
MNYPLIFISCVSPEFRQIRSSVAAILTRLGYTPVIQEIFGTEPGDLRQVLRDKIDACEGLIQIVGQGYGAEPPTVEADYGRVSYAQFELLYARKEDKKTWLIFAGDACTRDTALDRLDLPNDFAYPDPAGYQAERHALQFAYRERLKNAGYIYYVATSDSDLELKVEGLRNEFRELRWIFETFFERAAKEFGWTPPAHLAHSPDHDRKLRVFLCHAREDKTAVLDLYTRLSADGLDPWIDVKKLLPGQRWRDEIARAIRDADAILVCLSQIATTKIGYVNSEIRQAMDRADDQPPGKIFVIPLRLDQCDLPERFQNIQWVDYFEPDGYQFLMLAFKNLAGWLNNAGHKVAIPQRT